MLLFHICSQHMHMNMEERRKERNQNLRKKPIVKTSRHKDDIFITTKSNFKAQQKQCENLLNAGVKEIYLHCVGNAINRGINLALSLVQNSNSALTYAINTSTIHIIDELHPLCDDDDISFQRRNNSAIHIRISRNSTLDLDASIQSLQ